MFKTIPGFILCIWSLLLCVDSQCHSKWKLLGFQDVLVSGHIANSTVSTFEDCVSLCMNTINCKSVGITSIYVSNMMCYLYDVKVYSGQRSENRTGIVYYWPLIDVAQVSSYTCVEKEKYCYILYNIQKPWKEAQRACEDDGGYLFLVNSDEKYETVKEKVRGYVSATYYHVGATDEQLEDVWNWLDGGPVNRSYFIPGRPDNHLDNQHCLSFIAGNNNVGLDDRECSSSIGFFCEISLS